MVPNFIVIYSGLENWHRKMTEINDILSLSFESGFYRDPAHSTHLSDVSTLWVSSQAKTPNSRLNVSNLSWPNINLANVIALQATTFTYYMPH